MLSQGTRRMDEGVAGSGGEKEQSGRGWLLTRW